MTHPKLIFVVAAIACAIGAPSCDLLSTAECNVDTDCHGSHVCVANQCVECRTDRDASPPSAVPPGQAV